MLKDILFNILAVGCMAILPVNQSFADITCSGRVLQPEDFEPFIGATVIVDNDGELVGTATDLDGKFSFTVPDNCILKFEFGGRYFLTYLTAKKNMGDVILFERRGNGFKKVKSITETVKEQWNEEGLALIAKHQYKDAFKRFKASSEKGSARGMFLLAQCYRNEIGVKEDLKKYVEYMLAAADNGYDKAQYQVGVMYREGDILNKNDNLAKVYLTEAAGQGNTEAEKALKDLVSHSM